MKSRTESVAWSLCIGMQEFLFNTVPPLPTWTMAKIIWFSFLKKPYFSSFFFPNIEINHRFTTMELAVSKWDDSEAKVGSMEDMVNARPAAEGELGHHHLRTCHQQGAQSARENEWILSRLWVTLVAKLSYKLQQGKKPLVEKGYKLEFRGYSN